MNVHIPHTRRCSVGFKEKVSRDRGHGLNRGRNTKEGRTERTKEIPGGESGGVGSGKDGFLLL